MATQPRIPSDLVAGFTMLAEGADTPAARIAIPAELTRLAGIPISSEGSFQLDPVIHECIRLFNAKYQGCTYCMNARAGVAVQSGLTEDIVEQLSNFENGDLPEPVKAALRITRAIASAPQMVTPELLEQARRHFSEQEIVDIILLSMHTTGSKVTITLGLDPGKEASSRVFYPSEAVYGDSPALQQAIEAMKQKGLDVAAPEDQAYKVNVI